MSDYLNEEHFIQVLPLLHFLREATRANAWDKPPLRACLMFDDPNLRWPSYGFLRYRDLASLARTCGFHVALATIPLDAWATHRGAVSVFREHPGHLSLLIHGNNHLKGELGRLRRPEIQLRPVAQALRRIVRLEKATGLHVERVMTPPHGAYTESTLAGMLTLGLEGSCISRGSLRVWNREREWQPAFGLEMAEMMDGFPVLHRFRLAASCEGHIVMAAFLDRPIIPVGHHDSVSEGLELLTRTAAVVNSLGSVQWMSSEGMLRSNYLSVQESGTLRIRPYSCRIRLTTPRDVTAIVLDVPEMSDSCNRAWRLSARHGTGRSVQLMAGVPVKVTPGEEIECSSSELGKVDFRTVKRPRLSAWALPRRILCEGRDRLGPVMGRVRRKVLQKA